MSSWRDKWNEKKEQYHQAADLVVCKTENLRGTLVKANPSEARQLRFQCESVPVVGST
jgi:hypothetical protein